MKLRGILISLSLGFIAMSLMIILHPPETAEVNLGDAYSLIKGFAFIAVFVGCLVMTVCAKRLRIAGWIGFGLILASLLVSFILQKATGGSMGTPGWISAFVSILVIVPLGILLCSIAGIASLTDIIGTNPSAVTPVITSFAIPVVGLLAFYIIAGREPDIISLLKTFQNPDKPYEYSTAAFKLSNIENPAMVAPLVALLKNDNPRIRASVALALGGKSRHSSAIDQLIAVLGKETDVEAKQWMIRALGVTAPKANRSKQALITDVLIKMLKTEENQIKQTAAENLGFMKAKKAIKPLIDAMQIDDVRFHAHNALITITGQRLGNAPDAWLKWWEMHRKN